MTTKTRIQSFLFFLALGLFGCATKRVTAPIPNPAEKTQRTISSEHWYSNSVGVLKTLQGYLGGKSRDLLTKDRNIGIGDNLARFKCFPFVWTEPLKKQEKKYYTGIIETTCIVTAATEGGELGALAKYILHRASTEGETYLGPEYGKFKDLDSTSYEIAIPIILETGNITLRERVTIATDGKQVLHTSHITKSITGEGLSVYTKVLNNSVTVEAIPTQKGQFQFKFTSLLTVEKPGYFISEKLFLDATKTIFERSYLRQLEELLPQLQSHL